MRLPDQVNSFDEKYVQKE